MNGSVGTNGQSAKKPADADLSTVLLHGCRFKAQRRETYRFDILTEGDGDIRVASVFGDAGHITNENAACLAASAEMLTALVDLVIAHDRGFDLPWTAAQSAILAGFGAPRLGDRFINRYDEGAAKQTIIAGTTWRIARLGFCNFRHVMLRLATVGDGRRAHVDRSLDELRGRFRPEEA